MTQKIELLIYLENLHKNEYWTKSEKSCIIRNAERRNIKFIERYMRRISK